MGEVDSGLGEVISSSAIEILSVEQLNKLWETERVKYFKHRLDVLDHVVKVDTTERLLVPKIPGLSRKRLYRMPLFAKTTNRDSLGPEILLSLKRKAEFSLRQDFALIGKAEVADVFIFKGKKTKA